MCVCVCARACASDPSSCRDSIEMASICAWNKDGACTQCEPVCVHVCAGLQTRLPVQLQVRTVQKIGREDAWRRVWRQRGQARSPIASSPTSFSSSSAAPSPFTGAPHHGDIQPVHAVQGGVAKVHSCRVRGEAQVGRVHGGGSVVQDAGRAQHLAVKVINQRQAAVRLHAQQWGTCSALQEVFQASTACAGLSHRGLGGDEGLLWGGRWEVEWGWGWRWGRRVRVERGEGRVRVGLEARDFWRRTEREKCHQYRRRQRHDVMFVTVYYLHSSAGCQTGRPSADCSRHSPANREEDVVSQPPITHANSTTDFSTTNYMWKQPWTCLFCCLVSIYQISVDNWPQLFDIILQINLHAECSIFSFIYSSGLHTFPNPKRVFFTL